MQVVQFISNSPASALEQIHKQLGPEAVVLSVRRLPGRGVARFWPRKGRIEVLAGLPEASPTAGPLRPSVPDPGLKTFPSRSVADSDPTGLAESSPRWRSVAWLEAMGLLPAHAARLQLHLNTQHSSAPASLDRECQAVVAALTGFWSPPRPFPNSAAPQTHAFVGPPGSGKTTVLCKWLTLAVLTEERSACVWRLDGGIANTAEFLAVHCEMLGVPVERVWPGPAGRADLHFIDLPGVEVDDPQSLSCLRNQLSALPAPHIHLVLNAAYETSVLLAHWQAFAALAPTDFIFTHLDEESRRIKLWNMVLGTNCVIRYLSAGQKIPGEFQRAVPELLFPSEFRL